MQKPKTESRHQAANLNYSVRRCIDRMFGGSGWEVRGMHIGEKPEPLYFSDVRYGNSVRARAAAFAYRSRLLMKANAPKSGSAKGSTLDGIAPVTKGGQVVAYVAKSRLASGDVLSKTFRTAQRGPTAARALAVAERKKQLGQVGSEMLRSIQNVSLLVEPVSSAGPLDLLHEARIAAEIRNLHSTSLKGIRRLPEEGCAAGWRLLIRKNNERISRFFLDRDFGGAAGACARALEFREQL